VGEVAAYLAVAPETESVRSCHHHLTQCERRRTNRAIMNQQRHIVWEMTINGIVDRVLVFPREQLDWSPTIKKAVSAVHYYYFRDIEPNRQLGLSICDCDNPDTHKDRIGHKAQSLLQRLIS
jgi:hypothetical protein